MHQSPIKYEKSLDQSKGFFVFFFFLKKMAASLESQLSLCSDTGPPGGTGRVYIWEKLLIMVRKQVGVLGSTDWFGARVESS